MVTTMETMTTSVGWTSRGRRNSNSRLSGRSGHELLIVGDNGASHSSAPHRGAATAYRLPP